jgi:hypothetical protein
MAVSTYGAESQREYIAECWAEYIYSPDPRPVAERVGQLITEYLR